VTSRSRSSGYAAHGYGYETSGTRIRNVSPRPYWCEPSPSGGGADLLRRTDLASGQIRIPIAHKAAFPAERQQLVVVLRGETVTCGWNPQLGPDKQRSGLLRPPGEVLRRLVSADERLTITTSGGHVALQ